VITVYTAFEAFSVAIRTHLIGGSDEAGIYPDLVLACSDRNAMGAVQLDRLLDVPDLEWSRLAADEEIELHLSAFHVLENPDEWSTFHAGVLRKEVEEGISR